MAARTPRVCFTSLIKATATLLFADASQSAAPPSYLRNQVRSKAWRSPVGWVIVTGVNDKLDVIEGGVARVATIAAGTYATGADLATAVQTALNAMPGHTNTYTATYSTATRKFTLARNTGTDTMTLKFGSGGANFTTAAHHDLGFSDADKSAATTYTSDVGVFQSRHWLKADLGSAASFTVAFVSDHNLTNGTVTIQANATDVWTAPSFAQALAGSGSGLRGAFFASQSYRYLRALFDDTSNPAGFSQAGVWFVGPYLEPTRSFRQGHNESADDLSTLVVADQGAIYQDLRPAAETFEGEFFRLSRADRDALKLFEDAVGVGGCFFFAKDPQNYPQDETLYGALVDRMEYIQSVGDGVPPDRYAVRFRFREALA